MTLTETLIKLLKEKMKADGKETVIKQFTENLPETPKGRALKQKTINMINRLASEIKQDK